jgi:hypothetical protein
MKIIITGCGRSGTAYMSQLFNNMGLECKHENHFNPKNLNNNYTILDCHESSWLAAPHLLKMSPVRYSILHIVREPFKQINSLKARFFFEVPSEYNGFAMELLSLFYSGSFIEKYIKYYIYWNKLVEIVEDFGYIYKRMKIESIGELEPLQSFFRKSGIEIDKSVIMDAIKETPRDINKNTIKDTREPLTIDDIESSELRDKLLAISVKYGYNIG